ncbi:hypothetical protein BGZ82_011606 [Podila clonocystis]|nr:hypothetical protein BGZ82_011606 [Podila clonocystis]
MLLALSRQGLGSMRIPRPRIYLPFRQPASLCLPSLHPPSSLLFSRLHAHALHDNGENGERCFHEQGIDPDENIVRQILDKNIRPYFYYIDIHGQVFLQDTTPKNLTSCYKNTKFLDFFMTRIKPNTTGWFKNYRHVSPCGREMNFVQAADTPIVYHGLQDGQLLWAGTKKTPFLPHMVTVSASTGRIYHPLPHDYRSPDSDNPEYALIKSALVQTEFADSLESDSLEWQGQRFPLRTKE